MINKIGLGVSFFDTRFGGVYRGRQVLCIGRNGSGKSLLSYHFANQGIVDGDKVLLLSGSLAKDVVILGESYGMHFSTAVQTEQLILLEYAGLLGSEEAVSSNIMLPPEAFVELQGIIEAHSISRVVLDSVLPWVAIQPITRLNEHIYSFIHALDRLGVTTLMTLPKPISNASFALKKQMEDIVPVVLTMDHQNGSNRTMRVSKYLGESHGIVQPIPITIAPGKGLVLEAEQSHEPNPKDKGVVPSPAGEGRASYSFVPPKEGAASSAVAPKKETNGAIRFSDVIRS
jgi:KaiC/GvpD/RAD55 family RecA-like ATPase